MFSSCFLSPVVLKLIRIRGISPLSVGAQEINYLNEIVKVFFFPKGLRCCTRSLLGYSENWRLCSWVPVVTWIPSSQLWFPAGRWVFWRDL